MSNAADIETTVGTALAPLLKSAGGYLHKIQRFRGRNRDFVGFYDSAAPAMFVAVGSATFLRQGSPWPDATYEIQVTVLEQNERGETESIEGSGLSGEPGLYEMMEDVRGLLEGVATHVGSGRAEPMTVTSATAEAIKDLGIFVGVVTAAVVVRGAKASTSYSHSLVRDPI